MSAEQITPDDPEEAEDECWSRISDSLEVLAQPFLADRLLGRPIRRREKSNINRNFLCCPNRKHSALFDNAEELNLRLGHASR